MSVPQRVKVCGGSVCVPAMGSVRVEAGLPLVDLRNGMLRVMPPMQIDCYGTYFVLSNLDRSEYAVDWEWWK